MPHDSGRMIDKIALLKGGNGRGVPTSYIYTIHTPHIAKGIPPKVWLTCLQSNTNTTPKLS